MSIFTRLIDLIYPPRCHACGRFLVRGPADDRQSRYICPSCMADFRTLTPPHCDVCARPFHSRSGGNHRCESCLRKRPLFHTIGAPYLYEGSLKTVIHLFKYEGRSGLAAFLGPILASFARDWDTGEKVGLVMPVPLHPRRLRERGFNQSKLLAGHVAGELDTPLDVYSLRRIRHTPPQTGLGRAERRKNVRGAFHLRTPEIVRGKAVILVDDVATTGNTLNECTKVLLKSGARQVSCLVLARAAGPEW